MKSVFIPLAAALAFSSSVFAGTLIVPEPKPSLTITPLVPPLAIKVEPAKICPPTAQKVCENQEAKAEPKDTQTTQVKVEPKPAEPVQLPVPDTPTQS